MAPLMVYIAVNEKFAAQKQYDAVSPQVQILPLVAPGDATM
jgi:hypothetical protein